MSLLAATKPQKRKRLPRWQRRGCGCVDSWLYDALQKQHSPLKSNYSQNYFGANAVIARIFLVNIVIITIINVVTDDRFAENVFISLIISIR